MRIVSEKEARKSILEEAEKVNNPGFKNASPSNNNISKKKSQISLIKKILVDIKDLFLMLKDYFFGSYREVPFWIIASIIGAFLYIINPFDFLPDVIPVIGIIDDVIVLSLCLAMVGLDLKKYRKWKNKNS